MAITKTFRGGVGGASSGENTLDGQFAIEGDVLRLPTEPSIPKTRFQDYVMVLYGEKKIGKTSMIARFPNTLSLMFEPGGKALSILQEPMEDWKKFRDTLVVLEGSQGDQYATIAVDTVDYAYEMCFKYMCKKLVINHPTDENDYGKSWGLIEKEFKECMLRLLNLGKGVVFISHATEAEIKTRNQGNFTRVVPTMAKQAAKFFTAAADILAYYGYYGDDRFLVIRGNDNIQAGCRLENNFVLKGWVPKELPPFPDDDSLFHELEAYFNAADADEEVNKFVHAIPMGKSADASYRNLMRAFHNFQVESYEEVRGIPTILDTNAALKPVYSKRS